MGLLLGGVAAGWAKQKGYFNKLPQVGGSAAFTLAALGYGLSKYGKHKFLKAGGYALLAVGAFDFGKVQAGGTSGLDEHDEFGEGV